MLRWPAGQGLVAMLWVNAVHGLNVAPWALDDASAPTRMPSEFPGAAGPAMVLDFATSVVAEGQDASEEEPQQQAPLAGSSTRRVDRPQTRDLLRRSRGLAPDGGEHKGYGLSLAVEILGRILSARARPARRLGSSPTAPFMICLDVEPVVPLRISTRRSRDSRLGQVSKARARAPRRS